MNHTTNEFRSSVVSGLSETQKTINCKFFYDEYGSFDYAWYLSIGLSFFAALVHLPIDERPLPRLATT